MQGRILAFFAGLCLLHATPALPPQWLGMPLMVLLGLCSRARTTCWIAALIAGFVWGWWHASGRLESRLPVALDGAAVTIYATVSGLPEVSGERVRFRVRIDHADESPRLTGTARLSWYNPESIPQPGEYWRLRVTLRRPRGFANPGGFDYEGWLFREGLDATGYVRRGSNRLLQSASRRAPLARLRATLGRRISAILSEHPLLPVVLAVTVGDRAQMTQNQWHTLKTTGTGHLMAISGLHIGMVASAVFVTVRLLWGASPLLTRRMCAIDAAALLALIAALSYACVAGLTLPTRRALIMVGLALLALQRRRRIGVSRTLSVALLLVLLTDPFAPLSPGFWLSFGAVSAIAGAMHGYSPAYSGPAAWGRVQLAVSAGLLPFTLWQFGWVSAIAPLINIVLIPVFGITVMPLVLAGTALSLPWPTAGAVLLQAGAAALGVVWSGIEMAAGWSAALWTPSPRPVWTLVLALAAAGIALSPLARRLRPITAALFLPLIVWRPAPLPHAAFTVDVLDVGQGLSTVVTTRNHRLVYDTGGRFRSGTPLAELVVLPFLRMGPAPSMLVVSHGDLDHRGGVESILGAYPDIAQLGGEARDGFSHEFCRAGQVWYWDSVRFEILHPDDAAAWSGNNGSCVLRVEGPGGSMLLTGDIELAAEAHLIASGAALGADVVLGPHHGSNTSSTPALVAATGARHVVFAAGHGNRWNFPRPAVTRRWQDAHAAVWITGRDGAVRVTAQDANRPLRVTAWRREHRRYWSW